MYVLNLAPAHGIACGNHEDRSTRANQCGGDLRRVEIVADADAESSLRNFEDRPPRPWLPIQHQWNRSLFLKRAQQNTLFVEDGRHVLKALLARIADHRTKDDWTRKFPGKKRRALF